ncbi:MAG: hypothetical protein FWG98_03770 [Candidatus Cloacimonetes bacterium]|nr:hypothetical protein [Candidatus Cloacimonadota bacterium]
MAIVGDDNDDRELEVFEENKLKYWDSKIIQYYKLIYLKKQHFIDLNKISLEF